MDSSAIFFVVGVSGVVSLALLGFFLWSQRGIASIPATDYVALACAFMDRTGLRFAEMPDAPLEEQARAVVARQTDPEMAREGYRIEYVLRDHGRLVRYEVWTQLATVRSCWTVPFDRPPRVLFHILKARKVDPVYPHRVVMADPQMNAGLKIYGKDPVAVRHALEKSGLLDLLASCAAVDLRVVEDGVSFLDLDNRNVNTALGGRIGVAMTGASPEKMAELTYPVYSRMIDIVLLAAETSR